MIFEEILENNAIQSLYPKRSDTRTVRAYLCDFILFNLWTPTVLKQAHESWNTLPFYVQKEVPDSLQKCWDLPTPELDKKIKEYHLARAVYVLLSYRNCGVPLSKDKRILKTVRNLLSDAGEERLSLLKNALINKIPIDDSLEEKAVQSANKFLLDTDLFISFNGLASTTHGLRPWKGRTVLSMSSGCYNMCAHCGFEAKAPVSHMPYPVLLNLIKFYNMQLWSDYGMSLLYSDSDPISYRDDIIDADVGDVCRYTRRVLKDEKRIYPSFVTKGVLKSSDAAALAKAFEFVSVTLSYVNLPGEVNVDKNKERIQKSLDILENVSIFRRDESEIHLREYCLKGKEEPLNQLFSLPKGTTNRTIYPIYNGRWVETFHRNDLLPEHRGLFDGFSPFKDDVIVSDGRLFETSLGGNFHFKWSEKLNIFDYTHPTAVKKKNPLKQLFVRTFGKTKE